MSRDSEIMRQAQEILIREGMTGFITQFVIPDLILKLEEKEGPQRQEKIEQIMEHIELQKESIESYLAFSHGQMIPLRHDDTIEHLYSELEAQGK